MQPFKPLRSEKFAQEVANQIKASIFDGIYVSGDKLPTENDMAGMFGVSKVTIRQAVRILESSGILFTRQGIDGGIFVAEADATAVSSYLSDMLKLKRVKQSDLTMTRLIFEPDISAMVARVWQSEDLKEIYANIQQANMALSTGDLGSVRMLNLTYHRLICALTRNPVIIFSLNSVLDVLEENVFKVKLDREFVHKEIIEHEVIIEKIKKRNPEESRREMHKHIRCVHEKLETAHDILVEKNREVL
jgi:GntR family transcriptional repressor for pyruvate dehydrogenase complex